MTQACVGRGRETQALQFLVSNSFHKRNTENLLATQGNNVSNHTGVKGGPAGAGSWPDLPID